MVYFKKTTKKQLGELLLERGIITREQIQETLDHQKNNGGLFGEILVELGYASEEDIAQALTAQYGFPYLPLLNYEIDSEIFSLLNKDICERLTLIPVDKIGNNLTLAMANPLNIKAIEEVEMVSGCSVQVFVSTTADVKEALNKYYSS